MANFGKFNFVSIWTIQHFIYTFCLAIPNRIFYAPYVSQTCTFKHFRVHHLNWSTILENSVLITLVKFHLLSYLFFGTFNFSKTPKSNYKSMNIGEKWFYLLISRGLFRNLLRKYFNPIQDRGQKAPYYFSLVTATNSGISP